MPGRAMRAIMETTGLARESISIHITRIGGGFGRRLLSDYAIEAASLARMLNQPVQVVWDREDDLQHDYYRPAGYHKLQAGLDEKGDPIAWRHHLINMSRNTYRQQKPADATEMNADDFPAGMIPNFRVEYTEVKSGVPTGAWRAPAHNSNAFVMQSFIDEIANAAGKDPLQLRLQLLGDSREIQYEGNEPPFYHSGRLRAVLELAAQKSGWGTPLKPGYGRGIAAHFTFGSYAAVVAEVAVDGDNLRVQRMVCALDCGQIVNLSGIEAQSEGGVLDGLSAALFGEITIDRGRAQQSNFGEYRLLRINEAPSVEVYIVPSSERPTGYGEIALPPVAPALCNAIFNATGKRIRSLPIEKAGFKI
jgi:isoquinoline 1-oxidoreductase beta subunit